jgi:hypothetical protein
MVVFCAAGVSLTASTASAALITFNSRATFDAQAGVLPVETFEEGVVAAASVVPCPGLLRSTTINACFLAGDILPGLTLASSTVDPQGLALAGAGFNATVPSKSIFANSPDDTLNLSFDAASAVGFDLLSLYVNTIVTVSVFGAGDVLLGTFNVPGTDSGLFFGVINNAGAITRINLSSALAPYEGVDNVAFGAAAVTAVPEPASLTLLGGGLLGLARARRRLRG